ncbi:MAG: TPM domain-containing protein, partial [Patescibacteria group bacterium]
NGLLLLIAKDDREMRIEVGYGLEPVITDIESAHIIRDVLAPAFQQEKYDEGVTAAIERVMADISSGTPQDVAPVRSGFDWLGNIYIYFFLLIYLTSILSRSKSWWAGGIIGAVLGFIFSGFVAVIILAGVGFLFDYLVSKNYQKHIGRGTRPPWFIGGGGLGGGRGGGFGGFGGGMSGGGGASGRW